MRVYKDFHDISIVYREKSAHIVMDGALLSFLDRPGIGSLALADHILSQYQTVMGMPLAISRHSLAIEILGHVFADRLASSVQGFITRFDADGQNAVIRLMEKLREHTDVIDCGEAAVDSNRFIWDMLVPFKRIVYAAFGAAA